jgi:prefoldin subunit 5
MAVTAKAVHNLADKIRELKETLEGMKDAKQEVLDNAENADYPNEEKIEGLQTQVDILEEAFDSLESAVDGLENYE